MYVSLKDAAAYFGYSYNAMLCLCHDGIIPFIHVGKKYRVKLPDVEAALLERAEKEKPQRCGFYERLRAM